MKRIMVNKHDTIQYNKNTCVAHSGRLLAVVEEYLYGVTKTEVTMRLGHT